MIKIIPSEKDFVIAAEIMSEYRPQDEKELERKFEEKLSAGFEQVNMLIRIDKLPWTHISCKAFWEDGIYALRHIKNCGHIAVVSSSKVEKFLVGLDSLIFSRASKGLEEKYFDVEDLDKAWEFVNRQA